MLHKHDLDRLSSHPNSLLEATLPPPTDPDYAWIVAELAQAELNTLPNQERPARLAELQATYPCLNTPSGVMALTPIPTNRLTQTLLTMVTPAHAVPGLDEPRLPVVGEVFAGFQLIGELGSGAFGKVFLAEQISLAGRRVALKVTTRTTTEPEQLARLRHTNVVPIHSVHSVPPFQAVCMPFLGRRTLADLLQTYRDFAVYPRSRRTQSGQASTITPPQTVTDSPDIAPTATLPARVAVTRNPPVGRALVTDVVQLMARICRGLAHAHDRGILHLDLKPANVLIADDGEPLLLDFNLSFDRRTTGRERTGGTLPYMAPEQLDDFRDGCDSRVNERADLFAIGVMLYELLTGVHPFPASKGPTNLILLATARRAGAVPVRQLNPVIPPSLAALIHRLLAPDPLDRYPSASAVADDLERHLVDRPLKLVANTSARELIEKFHRRNPRLLFTSMLVGVLTATTGSGIGLIHRRAESLAMTASENALALKTELPTLRVNLTHPDPQVRAKAARVAQDLLATFNITSNTLERLDTQTRRADLQEPLGEVALLLAHADWLSARSAGTGPHEMAHAGLKWVGCAQRLAPSLTAAANASRHALAPLAGKVSGLAPEQPEGRVATFLEAARLVALNQPNEACKLLEQLTTIEPKHAAAQYLLATCQSLTGQAARAMDRLVFVKMLLPTDPRPCYDRAILTLHFGDPAAASSDIADALARDPANSDTLALKAALALLTNEANKALEAAEAALSHSPKHVLALLVRAQVRELHQDPIGATEDRALAAADRPEPFSGLESAARGAAALRFDPVRAVAELTRATTLSLGRSACWQSLVCLYADAYDQPQLALNAADYAIAAAPDLPLTRASRALLYARMKQPVQAREDIIQALANKPCAFTEYLAACVYAQCPEDHPAAVRHLRNALRRGAITPDHARYDPDLARLRSNPEFRNVLAAAAVLNDH